MSSTNEAAASISQFEDANHGRLQALELTTPNEVDEEEMTVLSPRLVIQPRNKNKSLPMLVFAAMAVFAVALFTAAMVNQNLQQQQQEQPSAQPLQEQEQKQQQPEEASSFGDKDSSSPTTTPPNNTTTNKANSEEPNNTGMPTSVAVENDPYPKCPPWSTKKYYSDYVECTDCFEMRCISDVPHKNTEDRLTHSVPLCKGQALCNQDLDKYPNTLFQFGLSLQGNLVWQQCNNKNETQTKVLSLWENNDDDNWPGISDRPMYFQITPNATWQVFFVDETHNTTILAWEQAVQSQSLLNPIQVTPHCLNNHPVLDCPYLHFRRHGAIVLNYVDPQDGWVACDSRKICYAELWK